MCPIYLHMSKENAVKCLRQLELEAYSLLVSALRAQGSLTQEKRKVLKETGRLLNISMDRHKTEVRRAVNDEKLNTIAYHIQGPGISPEDWCQEGRRIPPILQRISPQTLHPIITDSFSGVAGITPYEQMESINPIHTSSPESISIDSDSINYMDEFNEDINTVVDSESEQTMSNADYNAINRSAAIKSNFYNARGGLTHNLERPLKMYPSKKIMNKNQKLMVVPNSQSITTNSILHKTLSLPIAKVSKLNLDKFKIVSSSSISSSFNIANIVNADNTAGGKHKFITNKSTKKFIPLSQLQILNQKLGCKGGIKVLPINSKFFGKNVTMTRISPVLNNITSCSLSSDVKEADSLSNPDIFDKENEDFGENENLGKSPIKQINTLETSILNNESEIRLDAIEEEERTDDISEETKNNIILKEREDGNTNDINDTDDKENEIESSEVQTKNPNESSEENSDKNQSKLDSNNLIVKEDEDTDDTTNQMETDDSELV